MITKCHHIHEPVKAYFTNYRGAKTWMFEAPCSAVSANGGRGPAWGASLVFQTGMQSCINLLEGCAYSPPKARAPASLCQQSRMTGGKKACWMV